MPKKQLEKKLWELWVFFWWWILYKGQRNPFKLWKEQQKIAKVVPVTIEIME